MCRVTSSNIFINIYSKNEYVESAESIRSEAIYKIMHWTTYVNVNLDQSTLL